MELKELYDGKVRCVGYKRKERYFTIGKVYQVTGGCVTNDDGFEYTPSYGKTSPYWLREWYDFEVVEDKEIHITIKAKLYIIID